MNVLTIHASPSVVSHNKSAPDSHVGPRLQILKFPEYLHAGSSGKGGEA
jgi:hypothetical protein